MLDIEEVISHAVETYIENHVHMAQRLYPDVYADKLANYVTQCLIAEGYYVPC